MAKVSGLLVIVAGTASLCTAYVLLSSTATDHQIESKRSDLVKGPGSRTETALVGAPEGMRAYLRHSATPMEPMEDQAAPVVVTIAKRNITPGVSTSTVAARSPTPVPGASLVRELQRELRRVGCYDGALNESWTLATRTAMKTFTNRINAILPIDKPDQILLTLVQGYRDRVCGVACPPGEGLAKDGRCLSNVILARVTKRAPQNSATLAMAEQPRQLVIWSTVTPADPGIRNLAHGPMPLAEPPAEHADVPRVAGTAAAKTPRVRATAPQRASQRRRNFAFFGLFGW